MNSYLKISDGLYVAIFKFHQQILPNVGFYPMSIACLQLEIDSGGEC